MANIRRQVLHAFTGTKVSSSPEEVCSVTGLLRDVVNRQINQLVDEGCVESVTSIFPRAFRVTAKGWAEMMLLKSPEEPAPLPGMTPEQPAVDEGLSHVCLADDTFDPWWDSLDVEVKAHVFRNFYLDADNEESEAAHA